MLDAILRINSLAAVLDILIVASVLYWLMLMFRGTRAERMLWGLGIIVLVYFLSKRVELLTLHWILSNFLGSIAIFIIVVFQQDIRRALVQMGKPFSSADVLGPVGLLEEITKAADSMSKTRTGSLIVLERAADVDEFLDAGVEVDAKVSKEILLSIFKTDSPMHDGAVVIRGGRLYRAGCILPLTKKDLTKFMGTRHRAAMGLAEETDAAIIVVSEQTGEITLVVEDAIYVDLAPEKLLGHLRELFSEKKGQKRMLLNWKSGV